jgi:hypothetical protein
MDLRMTLTFGEPARCEVKIAVTSASMPAIAGVAVVAMSGVSGGEPSVRFGAPRLEELPEPVVERVEAEVEHVDAIAEVLEPDPAPGLLKPGDRLVVGVVVISGWRAPGGSLSGVLAATLFAHESAVLGVHGAAGLGDAGCLGSGLAGVTWVACSQSPAG